MKKSGLQVGDRVEHLSGDGTSVANPDCSCFACRETGVTGIVVKVGKSGAVRVKHDDPKDSRLDPLRPWTESDQCWWRRIEEQP